MACEEFMNLLYTAGGASLRPEPKEAAMQINMGLSPEQRETMADAVTKLLADTYALYFKTHAYHWNVTGPRFHDLHAMFEEQYTEMWQATDELAERVRALGVMAPINYDEITKSASVSADASTPSADQMIANLVEGHEQVVRTARAALSLAGEHDDEATADIVAPRVTAHEKMAWMLRVTLG
jgi:starvation-inducible DNA-binding protein